MDDQRPDPDELLARLHSEEAKKQRGKLKIFFGAAAGVGKTYNMLDAAQMLRGEGVDVVVGYVEPHNRPETEALLNGLEIIAPRLIEYRGTTIREFDIDAALVRHPTLILVDELAHTNAAGSRHAKRWQDVEELLDAGVNVYTTVNVQHLESLNDVIAQITGAVVRETVPDSLLEEADEVELIDLSPDDLLKRLREGKVYLPQQAEQAMENFFRKGNLMALRELALRRTAERVDTQMQVYRHDKAVEQIWPAGERILVCISPSPLASRLVRAAKRMAAGLHADWITVYVESPGAGHLDEAGRNSVNQTLRLAEQLGAETATLSGHDVTEEVLNFARRRNITKIVVGKPDHARWRDVLFGSVLNDLIRKSGSIDVYVISGEADNPQPPPMRPPRQDPTHWLPHLKAALVVFTCAVLAALLFPYFAPANIVMIFLVGIVYVAVRYGRGPSVLASLVSVIVFDFFFIPPHLTFAVSDTQYFITFGVMLLVALTISSMTVRIKEQAEVARERERRTSSLYGMSREFANTRSIEALAQVAINHIHEVFDSQVLLLLPIPQHDLQPYGTEEAKAFLNEQERGVARWVYDHGQEAGVGTQTLPGSDGFYLPLQTSKAKVGVVGIYPAARQIFSPDQLHLLEIYVNQTALALERAYLSDETERAQVQIETERMRNALLSSVSHDLRTPLAAITGAVSGLLEHDKTLDPHSRELIEIAYEEAERLNRLVGNLLDMTRLEAGGVRVDKEWQPLEEVIGTTTLYLEKLLDDHPLKTTIPDDLPLVPIDSILIGQVLVNLLENAVKYSPAGSPIDLSAWAEHEAVVVEVADRGPGLAAGEETRIFEKFYRTRPTTTSGAGLGLAICRAIVEAHGGRIWAANRAGGGAVFRFTLPLDGEPPQIKIDDE
jgi:two-component system, OmpR family, sensor histidine kinase KdpD